MRVYLESGAITWRMRRGQGETTLIVTSNGAHVGVMMRDGLVTRRFCIWGVYSM
jgi:hypothetical protein